MKHILWDWNGTLLDDTRAALDTLNFMLRERGSPEIGMDFYRDNFAFPVRPFYERIGVCLENEDWDALAREYHEIYSRQEKRLCDGAVAALEAAKSAGARQSVISALRQDLLDAALGEYGIAGYFDFVYGVDNLDGESKLSRARELVDALRARGDDPRDAVLIGDALHDKEVADAIGVRCVLCASGSHAAWRLAKAAPTGETIADALAIALGLV